MSQFRIHKYRVAPAEQRRWNGRTYASKAEMQYAQSLHSLQEQGHIASYTHQPRFALGIPENVYVADFRVVLPDGQVYIVDVKGHETSKFKRDKKLWRKYGPAPLHIVKKRRNGFVTSEIIQPENKQ